MKPNDGKAEDALIFVRNSSAKLFNLSNPSAKDVSLFDIAHALSRVQRFTGHIDQDEAPDFTYSVGQHSIMVSRLVPSEFALEGLLHDGAEAYVNDLSTPLKNKVGAPYKDIELSVHTAIAERFRIPVTMSPEVKVADRVAFEAELSSMFPDDERLNRSSVNFAWMKINPMSPDEVRRAFLDRFAELAGAEAYRVQLIGYNPVIPAAIELANKYFRKSLMPKEIVDARMRELREVMVEASRNSVSPTTIAASILSTANKYTTIPLAEIIDKTNSKIASTCAAISQFRSGGARDEPLKRQERIVMRAIKQTESLSDRVNFSATNLPIMSDILPSVMCDYSPPVKAMDINNPSTSSCQLNK